MQSERLKEKGALFVGYVVGPSHEAPLGLYSERLCFRITLGEGEGNQMFERVTILRAMGFQALAGSPNFMKGAP